MKRRRQNKRTVPPKTAWYRSTLAFGLAGSLLLYLAFPPVGAWPLVWLAPIFWISLIQQRQLPGRRPFLALWFAGLVYWLMMLEGIRLAHPANNIGWVVMASYLAVYLPCFVGLTRVAVHRLRVSIVLAAPVVWTGLELARGYLITGYSMGLMGHTLYERTQLIQVSDLFGAYGVSFYIVLAAACLVRIGQFGKSKRAIVPAATLISVSLAVFVYGYVRTHSRPGNENLASRKVALIQHSVDKKFVADPERNLSTFYLYRDLSIEARDQHPDLDLMVWPESVFTENLPEYTCDGPFALPKGAPIDPEQARKNFRRAVALFQDKVRGTADSLNKVWSEGAFQRLDIYLIVGSTAIDIAAGDEKDYNSVLLLHPEGRILDRYYKIHPVMFGEYIPFGGRFPWIYKLTPMSRGLSRGKSPRSFEVKGLRFSPSICFESTVPHLIRRQVRELELARQKPDVLVNVTDDGWFMGASILDQQLACAVFRSVELRRPFLVAANTGISAWIDGNGRIRERGPRRDKRIIIAHVTPDGRPTLYGVWGDVPAALCTLVCLGLAVVGFVHDRRARGRIIHQPTGR